MSASQSGIGCSAKSGESDCFLHRLHHCHRTYSRTFWLPVRALIVYVSRRVLPIVCVSSIVTTRNQSSLSHMIAATMGVLSLSRPLESSDKSRRRRHTQTSTTHLLRYRSAEAIAAYPCHAGSPSHRLALPAVFRSHGARC